MANPKTPLRPLSLRVGYITFSVEYLSEKEWTERGLSDGDGGQTNGAKASIVVRIPEGLDEIHVREVLLHEVLHACFYASMMTIEGNLRIQEDIEEHVVGRLSPVLLETLRDNPGLAAYLQA